MSKDLMEIIRSRRSIRKFKAEKVDPQMLRQVLKAGLFYPSSKSRKPVELIVVEDPELLQRLKVCKSTGTIALETAPCAVVVIADTQKSDAWVEDASIVTILMQLEAERLGLGSVWIQIRNRRSLTRNSDADVRAVLNIPDHYGVLNILALGHKNEEKRPYDEDSLDFSPVHTGRF